MKIRDSVAFTTGANRGIGLAFAQELLAPRARKVNAGARDSKSITVEGTYPVRLDVTKPETFSAAASKAAAWALTNWLRTALREQGTQVVGVHAGPVDTDMAKDLTLPKVTPLDVVRQGCT